MFLCLSSWDQESGRSLLLDFMEAHASCDPVALGLLVPEDPRRAKAGGDTMLVLLGKAGYDPVPDLV